MRHDCRQAYITTLCTPPPKTILHHWLGYLSNEGLKGGGEDMSVSQSNLEFTTNKKRVNALMYVFPSIPFALN